MIEKKKSSVFSLFLEFFLIFFLCPLRFFLFRGKIILTTLRNTFYGKISIDRRQQSAQQSLLPVSYTHLDVYKRQNYFCFLLPAK